MKIKKVAQTPGVLATVSTSKIDSDKDTYSCNYLNDNAVVVSPTEPSDGKVWLERSGNIFDTRLLKQGNWNASNNFERVVWGIKVKAGTTYTLTNYSSRRVSAFETSTLEQSISGNSVLVEHGSIDGNGNLTFTTKNNAYLRLLFSNIDSSQISVNDIISSNIQIEQGDTETIHEEYIEPTIYTKNDNGAYEEFYKVGNYREYDVIYEGELLVGGTINLNNAKRFLDVYFSNVNYSLLGKYTIDTKLGTISWGSVVLLATDSATALEYYVDESSFDKTNKIFTHTRSGYFNISSGVYTGKNTAAYRVYRIETYD